MQNLIIKIENLVAKNNGLFSKDFLQTWDKSLYLRCEYPWSLRCFSLRRDYKS